MYSAQSALIYDSPVTQTKSKVSYNELLENVSKMAGVLASLGVTKGDRVIIYMPVVRACCLSHLY